MAIAHKSVNNKIPFTAYPFSVFVWPLSQSADMSDATTDRTNSHLTNPAKIAGQVIDETTSHLTKTASCQVIGYGYSRATKQSKNDCHVAGYKHTISNTMLPCRTC